MTGSPDQNASRLNDFLTAAKGESASLTARKGKPLHPFSIRLTQEERERLAAEAKGKPLGVYIRERLLNEHRNSGLQAPLWLPQDRRNTRPASRQSRRVPR